jgi:hypothetical protein
MRQLEDTMKEMLVPKKYHNSNRTSNLVSRLSGFSPIKRPNRVVIKEIADGVGIVNMNKT